METIFLELIDKIYAAALNPQTWPAVLSQFAQCVSGHRGTSLMLTRLKNEGGQYGQGCLLSYVRHEPAWVAEFDQYYFRSSLSWTVPPTSRKARLTDPASSCRTWNWLERSTTTII